jgi:recombination protein RecA
MAKTKMATKKVFKDELNNPRQKKVWVNSGSVMLNLMLSGKIDKGYVRGRFVNVVGDNSTGKTLLAEELVNVAWYWTHKKLDKKVIIFYDEPEAAFDMEWAIKLGVPVDDIIWINSKTVDQFHANLWKSIRDNPDAYLIIYILDSLDALSDEAEKVKLNKKLNATIKKMEKDDDDNSEDEKIKGTMGAGKAKGMSEFFRNMAQEMNHTNCILFIISQTRDNIGVMFGAKQKRSGGKALDFYASQVFWLHEAEKYKTDKSKIVKGIRIVSVCKKNKVASPYRTVSFDILFAYGVDNYGSCIDFLKDHDMLEGKNKIWWKDKKYTRDEFRQFLDKHPNDWEEILELVQETWNELEKEAEVDLRPKYSNGED